MKKAVILMTDVIGSRKAQSRILQRDFAEITAAANQTFADVILSPLTITLGDELQGVVSTHRAGFDIIFYMEELLLETQLKLNLRYVQLEGQIDTPINPERAHGMLGPGLAQARKILTDKYRGKPRYEVSLPDPARTDTLNRLWKLLENLQAHWNRKDYSLILAMISNESNRKVGELFGKTASQIWKRRRTLRIEDYCLLKNLLYDMLPDDGGAADSDGVRAG